MFVGAGNIVILRHQLPVQDPGVAFIPPLIYPYSSPTMYAITLPWNPTQRQTCVISIRSTRTQTTLMSNTKVCREIFLNGKILKVLLVVDD